ncbi:KAR-UP F-box 1 [Artemisia annua]|uniref:KAR-UP F-box 1 n=1 Tax=Artemisia annua TaxID=35608 RepID=A0A2U1NYD1_ARTAN|nr:KAR-UP F-box 1 [Artemisia annua]
MAPSFDNPTTSTSRAAVSTTAKRRKIMVNDENHYNPLLPGLPDHIAQLCLNLVPPSKLYSVCRSWRRVIYTRAFPSFLSIYTLSSDQNSTLQLSSFDPISSTWTVVTPTPPDLRCVCLRHPSFIARNLPVQSASVAGNLVLLAGSSSDLTPAISKPLIFDPLTKSWSSGPEVENPRRWCVAGASRAAVVCASGIGSHYSQTVARSVDKWVLPETNPYDKKCVNTNGVWSKMKNLKDVKFSREAIDAVGVNGKLYMVNGEEGAVYDVNMDTWTDMPAEMLAGWRGPAAAMDEEVIFMVDEIKGVLRKYDDVMKVWVDVLEDERLIKAEHIAAGGGRVCVARGGGVGILVVDVVASTPRVGMTVYWDVSVTGSDVSCKEEFVPEDEGSYNVLVQKGTQVGRMTSNLFHVYEPGKILITFVNPTSKNRKIFYRVVAVASGLPSGMAIPPVNTAATSAVWPAASLERHEMLRRH